MAYAAETEPCFQRHVSVVIGPEPQIAPKKHCVPSLWQKWNAALRKTV